MGEVSLKTGWKLSKVNFKVEYVTLNIVYGD